MNPSPCHIAIVTLAAASSTAIGAGARTQTAPLSTTPDDTQGPVTLVDRGDRWTLDNGIVRLTILKGNAEPASIIYRGTEILTKGHYWEQQPSGKVTARVTIDPATKIVSRDVV